MEPQLSPAEPGRVYFPAMDGLRAIAAAGVLILHLSVLTGMIFRPDGTLGPLVDYVPHVWVGVPIFFAISGFLLYWPWAVEALADRSAPAVGVYLWHRVLRIMPAYWVLVAATLVVYTPGVVHDVPRLVRLLTLQHVFVQGDYPQTPKEPPGTGPLTQTWSLATEMHFYVLLPVIALGLARLLRHRHGYRISVALLASCGAADLVWRVAVSGSWHSGTSLNRWWLPGYLGFFAIGMLLALTAVRFRATVTPPAAVRAVIAHPWLCWLVAAAAFAVVTSPVSKDRVVVEEICYLVIVAALAAPVALAPGKGPALLLRRPVMAWLGRISYGVFLWHIFVQMAVLRVLGIAWGTVGVGGFLLLLPVTAALAVGVAWLSSVLVERPLQRRFRARSQRRGARPYRPLPHVPGKAESSSVG
jgi:peptidoglycan/LPS O-acetylase OafA/YrhL